MGKNATLSAHVDKDFFFSLTTVLLKNYVPSRDADRVIAYFVFPDIIRKSVPLRRRLSHLQPTYPAQHILQSSGRGYSILHYVDLHQVE
mmetsp:Transcript_3137/g.7054  ORF Transcript_3137/g.7054 Transcript_3137/m.7054 type:complete len:89 (+) Transcript_3137:460-726(+)